jgi:hypothetical protein
MHARDVRREDPVAVLVPDPTLSLGDRPEPEANALLADTLLRPPRRARPERETSRPPNCRFVAHANQPKCGRYLRTRSY